MEWHETDKNRLLFRFFQKALSTGDACEYSKQEVCAHLFQKRSDNQPRNDAYDGHAPRVSRPADIRFSDP